MSRENYFMGLLSLVLSGYVVVLGVRRFFPKAFVPGKFIIEGFGEYDSKSSVFKRARIRRSVCITLGLLIVATSGRYIPLPGLNLEVIASILKKFGKSAFLGSALSCTSIFALGIMPFLSANSLLLLVSIIIPRVRKFSQSVANSNQIITRWVYFLTAVLCIVQGYQVSKWLQIPGVFGVFFEGTLVISPGVSFTISSVILMGLGTLAMLLIANGIGKFGVGHGISLVITLGMCLKLMVWLFHRQGFNWAPAFWVTMAVLVLAFWLLRIKRVLTVENVSSGRQTSLHLSINQSGITPIIFLSSLMMLLLTFTRFSNSTLLNRFADAFSCGPLYYAVYLSLLALFSLVYGRIAFNPRYMAVKLRQNNLKIVGEAGENEENVLIRILVRLNLMWAGILAIYFVFLNTACNMRGMPCVHKIPLLVIPAVILGCLQTILRRSHDLKEIYVHSELGEMLVAKSYLETRGIKTYLDNVEAYGRLFCYFIGPLATKQLFVSPQDYPRASELIQEYVT